MASSTITFILSITDLLKKITLEPLITGPLLLSLSKIWPSISLPPSTTSKISTALKISLAFGIIRKLNNFLSDRVLNNWESDIYAWESEKEIVVVTGGSSGFGELVTLDLGRRGVRVVVVDVVEPKYEIPETARFFQCDLSKQEEITKVCAAIRDTVGNPTVLLNNAGIAATKTILDTQPAEYATIFNINTISHLHLVKEFLPSMIERNHGHIITIASMASFLTWPCLVPYSQTKASALAFHEGLSQEIRHVYGARKIRTSIFHPTWTDTPMTRFFLGDRRWRQLTLEAGVVAREMVECVVGGRSRHVCLPGSWGWMGGIRGCPNWVQEGLRNSGAVAVDVIRR